MNVSNPFLFDGYLSYLEFVEDVLFRKCAKLISRSNDGNGEWFSMISFIADHQTNKIHSYEEVTSFGYSRSKSWSYESSNNDISIDEIFDLILSKLPQMGKVEEAKTNQIREFNKLFPTKSG